MIKRIFLSPGICRKLNGLRIPSENRLKWFVNEYLNCNIIEKNGFRRYVVPASDDDPASNWFIYLDSENFDQALNTGFKFIGSYNRVSRELIRLYNIKNQYQDSVIYHG